MPKFRSWAGWRPSAFGGQTKRADSPSHPRALALWELELKALTSMRSGGVSAPPASTPRYLTLLGADKHFLKVLDLGTDQLGKREVVELQRGYDSGNLRWILLHA